jgi:hypothetical protein
VPLEAARQINLWHSVRKFCRMLTYWNKTQQQVVCMSAVGSPEYKLGGSEGVGKYRKAAVMER